MKSLAIYSTNIIPLIAKLFEQNLASKKKFLGLEQIFGSPMP